MSYPRGPYIPKAEPRRDKSKIIVATTARPGTLRYRQLLAVAKKQGYGGIRYVGTTRSVD